MGSAEFVDKKSILVPNYVMSSALSILETQLQSLHEQHPSLRDFVSFPDDISTTPVVPKRRACTDLMTGDATFQNATHPLAQAFFGAAHLAQWRETYAGTNIGDDFMNRFGCYCAIGGGGFWMSDQMSGYVVTMPPNLLYPWHHHPAEEMYVVLAGQAEFYKEGETAKTLAVGDTSFHASNQPHAMQTFDTPVMAYVTWRNHLDTPPVLTQRPVNSAH